VRPPQLTHPSELNTLSVRELISRVRPILKKGGLTTNPHRWRRIRENIPSTLAELSAKWEQTPRLNDRPISFGEYVATMLCSALHELDQEQNPHLYDHHRNYRVERETLPLIDEQETPLPVLQRPIDPAAMLLAKHTTQEELLQNSFNAGGVHTASQVDIWDARDRFNQGAITTPYALKRALGATRDEARTTPATAAFIQLEDLRDGHNKTTFDL
jgi:hypothetical protein